MSDLIVELYFRIMLCCCVVAAMDWHKGKAVLFLLKEMMSIFGWDSLEDVYPIYLGDDVSDEDAFGSILEEFGQGENDNVAAIKCATFLPSFAHFNLDQLTMDSPTYTTSNVLFIPLDFVIQTLFCPRVLLINQANRYNYL